MNRNEKRSLTTNAQQSSQVRALLYFLWTDISAELLWLGCILYSMNHSSMQKCCVQHYSVLVSFAIGYILCKTRNSLKALQFPFWAAISAVYV